MLPFLVGRQARITDLLDVANDALQRLVARDPDATTATTALLEAAVVVYRELGPAPTHNELRELLARHALAAEGTDPSTLERITSHRRSMQRAVTFTVLERVGALLRADWSTSNQALEDIATNLRVLVANALARGLVQPADLPITDDASADALWQRLLNEPDFAVAASQLGLRANVIDLRLTFLAVLGRSGEVIAMTAPALTGR